ncbi:hypothetical protein BDD12DRAFT_316965 [Trichophaea hybrida]|nr:hypothetical protein BDD12DRAFT_316965 [Trichophaea hybrida]
MFRPPHYGYTNPLTKAVSLSPVSYQLSSSLPSPTSSLHTQTMSSLPPLTEPHMRLTSPPHLLLHPPNLDSFLPSTQLPVYQKTSATTWSYLGRYQLLSTVPASSVQDHDPQSPSDGSKICVFAWSETAEFELCPEEEEGGGQVGEVKEEVTEIEIETRQVQLPPTPPQVTDEIAEEISQISSAYFSKPVPTAPVSMLTPEKEKEIDVAGSYADLSMSESHYSDFSGSGEDAEESSTRWGMG